MTKIDKMSARTLKCAHDYHYNKFSSYILHNEIKENEFLCLAYENVANHMHMLQCKCENLDYKGRKWEILGMEFYRVYHND